MVDTQQKLLKLLVETSDLQYFDELSEKIKKNILDFCFENFKYKKSGNIFYSKILMERGNVKLVKCGDGEISIYQGSFDLPPLEQLKRIGATIIPIIPLKKIQKYRRQFLSTLESFPEYARSKTNPTLNSKDEKLVYVLGGFAALGNPSSFHNPFVRKLRRKAFEKAKPLFSDYMKGLSCENKENTDSIRLQTLVDRMMYRLKGQKAVAESWHRDVIPKKKSKKGDVFFGGWINCDAMDQHFSFIPGSHINVVPYELDEGFATLQKYLEKNLPKGSDIKKKIKKITSYKTKFAIPPGHMIIFPQYILHEVVATPAKIDMMRLFTGWRLTTLTTSEKPLYPMRLFENQNVIPLPGGMSPPMYSSNHVSYFLNKEFQLAPGIKSTLLEWSNNTFKKKLLVEKTGKIGKYTVIPRTEMSGLKEMFPNKMYPPYDDKEKSIYEGEIL